MCGIAGVITQQTTAEQQNTVKAMCDGMTHRGPDARKVICEDLVCLGHSRLSIIDLNEQANQPMWSADQQVVVVLNGEIYNFPELKKELTGYPFSTSSDTEVVIAAYQRWGKDFIHRLKGMFSFVLYDKTKQMTLMARDRFGKKPLYYYQAQDGLWFASEIRALLNSKVVPAKVNTKVLGYYLQYQTVHYPDTIIKDVHQLPPGTFALVQSGKLDIYPYFHEEQKDSRNSASSESSLQQLFYESVEKRLISDVPIAVLLSAGIDSNLILSAASRVRKMDAFTIGFQEKEFDESELAARSARHYGAQHHIIKLSAEDFIAEVRDTLGAMDHPSGDGPNTYLICKQIRQAGFTVALSGLGGDELFYGYPHYGFYQQFKKSSLFRMTPSFLLRGVAAIAKNNRLNKLAALHQEINDPAAAMSVFRSNFDQHILKSHFGLGHQKYAPIRDENVENAISLTEMQHYMHDVLLRDADQMSMAHSVELRNPFLDQDLVQFVRQTKNKPLSPPKGLLIEALKQDLPDFILNKKKTGFTFPWDQWMRTELFDFCQEQMLFLEETALFRSGSIAHAWTEFTHNSALYTWSRVWPLVTLGYWIKANNIEY